MPSYQANTASGQIFGIIRPASCGHGQVGDNILHRRDFLAFGAMGVGGLMLPAAFGKVIAAEALDSAIDVAVKKQLADAAMNAAKTRPRKEPFIAFSRASFGPIGGGGLRGARRCRVPLRLRA